jgi:2-dehydro-3-deoxygluconokinase
MNTSSTSIVCFGELLVRLSAPGRELLLQSPALQVHVGGAEANVAVSLRRLGHTTAVVSAVPDNTLGHACVGELRKHDVDTSGVQHLPGRMGLYFLTHGAGHRPAEVLYDRADSSFAKAIPNAFDWTALLANAQWLHVSGITPAVSANAAESARLAMTAARAKGIKVSFDCNFRARLWGARTPEAPAILRDLASHADLLFGDQRDIALIFGTDFARTPKEQHAQAAADIAFKAFPNLQWIASTIRNRETMDSQELAGLLHTRTGTYTSRFFTLSGIVDRIGSGDAFAAGVIDQILAQATPQAIAEFGCAAAILKHSIPGDFNLSSREDIQALLAEHTTDVRR